jgi:DNA-binding NarL/FixJ family response regulator
VLTREPDIDVIAESGDGQEALDLLTKITPNVVLMDVNLPGLNGLQVTHQLKNRRPEINVIILTAYDDEEQIYHAIRIGASAYFAKDVAPSQLLDTVRTVAQGY